MRLVIVKLEMKMINRSHRSDINRELDLDVDTNLLNIKSFPDGDAYIYYATLKQHLKLNLWKS